MSCIQEQPTEGVHPNARENGQIRIHLENLRLMSKAIPVRAGKSSPRWCAARARHSRPRLRRAQDRGRDAHGRRRRRGDVIREGDHQAQGGGDSPPAAFFPWRGTYERDRPDGDGINLDELAEGARPFQTLCDVATPDECDMSVQSATGLKRRHEWHPGELYPRVGFIVTNMSRPAERVVAFYNKRGTCEQWIKEGKGAIKWTRLSCRTFAANAVRLQLHALACNLANFLRTLATPEPIKDWSLTTLKDKLIKIGAKVVSHGRYVIFHMAEVAIARQMFQEILRLIAELRPQPPAVA